MNTLVKIIGFLVLTVSFEARGQGIVELRPPVNYTQKKMEKFCHKLNHQEPKGPSGCWVQTSYTVPSLKSEIVSKFSQDPKKPVIVKTTGHFSNDLLLQKKFSPIKNILEEALLIDHHGRVFDCYGNYFSSKVLSYVFPAALHFRKSYDLMEMSKTKEKEGLLFQGSNYFYNVKTDTMTVTSNSFVRVFERDQGTTLYELDNLDTSDPVAYNRFRLDQKSGENPHCLFYSAFSKDEETLIPSN